jgi:hypothetical protein
MFPNIGPTTLGRRERTDRHIVSVRIPEGELPCSSVRVHVRLLFEPVDESACPLQGHLVVVYAEEQEEPVARCRFGWAHQGGMLVRAPPVEAEQDGSIRIQDLTKVVMARRRLGLAEERLVPSETAGNVAYADDRPCAFHRIFRYRSNAVPLTAAPAVLCSAG